MRPVHPALRRAAVATALCATAVGLAVGCAPFASADTVPTWTASAPIPVGSTPALVTVDPTTHRAFVTNSDGDGTQLTVIDTTTNAVTGTISSHLAFPAGLVVDPTTQMIYASAYGSTISVTGEDGTAATSITVPGATQLGAMSLDSTDQTLYVAGLASSGGGGFGGGFGGTDQIWAVDLSSGTVTVAAAPGGFSMGGTPPLAVDPTTHVGYIGTGPSTVADLTTGTISSTPQLGTAVAVDASRHALWTANVSGGAASLIDTRTGKLVVTVPLGGTPAAITVDPVAGLAYVTNSSYNSVSVIDEDSHAVLATVPVDVNPQALAVDPSTHDVYVANSSAAGTVSVIHQGTSTPTPQVIHFTSTVPAHAYVQGTYTATATGGGSTNRVHFSTDPASYGVCNVSLRGVVVFAKTGTCIVDADQDGSGSFADAPTAEQTIHVVQRTQAITFPALKSLRVGQKQALRATSSATLPVTYTVRTPKTCTVSRGYVVAKAAGSCGVTANAAGNAAYAKAVAKSAAFAVNR